MVKMMDKKQLKSNSFNEQILDNEKNLIKEHLKNVV